ncbi:MAG: hypothetical protein R2815_14040 [Flavobacteriales bacterium]
MHTHTPHRTPFEQEYLAWYQRRICNPGVPFDAAALARAVAAQFPTRPLWIEAAARCTRAWPENELITYFMSWPERKRRWWYVGGFVMDHPTLGTLIVDLVRDAAAPQGISIGSIEFLDRVLGRRTSALAFLAMLRRPN